MTKENLVAPVSVDKIPRRKRLLSLQFLCSFCGQDSMPKENLVAPVSVFFLWTRFHSERKSCRSSFCVLSVDKIPRRKRLLSLQFLCSFCGQDSMPKENLVAAVSVFVLWTKLHCERESCRSSFPPRPETRQLNHIYLFISRVTLSGAVLTMG
jgi:transcription elongation factor Elf1